MRQSFIRVLVLVMAASSLLTIADAPAVGRGGVRNGPILIKEYPVISSMRPDGTGYRVLVDAVDEAWGATWSPDKTRFAYFYEEEGEFALYVANADGSDAIRVAEPDPFSYTWSPESRYIAYTDITRNDPLEGSCYGIYIVNVETLARREVTDGPECRADDVQWSPAGDELAVVDGWDSGERTLNRDIYKVDIVTGELTPLTDTPALDRRPRWSPDGRSLLFESSRDRPITERDRAGGCMRMTEIFRMRSDGSRQQRLTSELWNPDCGASWSNDGTRIVWTTFVKKDEDDVARPGVVRVMRSDGSGKRSLSHPRRAPSHSPDFAPDGRWVIFLSLHEEDDTSYFDLHKVRTDGSQRDRLTRRGKHAGRPDW